MKYFFLALMLLFVFVLAGCGNTSPSKAKTTPTATVTLDNGQHSTAPQDKGAIVQAITETVSQGKAHPDPQDSFTREIVLPIELTGDVLYQDDRAFVGVKSTGVPVYFELIYTSPSEATAGATVPGESPVGWGVMSFGIAWHKQDCNAETPLIKQRMYSLNLCI